MSIEENTERLLKEIAPFHATLVAATKTRTPEEIRRAIGAGITAVGENKVQEFRDKFDLVQGAERHFIGNLQTNKVKYLVGKCDLIHSVGSMRLGEEIASRAHVCGTVQNILLEVNLGEAQKGGFPLSEALSAYEKLSGMPSLSVKGFMAMLPAEGEPARLASLCDRMRRVFEEADAEILSMGMSGDYLLCLEHGSNMVRLGTAIFGERNSPAAPAGGLI